MRRILEQMLPLFFSYYSYLSLTALAVDRSKFRTCQQTSFCRRQRNFGPEQTTTTTSTTTSDSAGLSTMEYVLLPDSIQFHPSPAVTGGIPKQQQQQQKEDEPPAQGQEETKKEKRGVLWDSLSKRWLGSSKTGSADKDAKDAPLDPYVRGPDAQITGNISRKKNYYTNNNNNSTTQEDADDNAEMLQFSLLCLAEGVLRLRLTEIYGTPGTAYEKARVTYDQVVLERPEAWQTATHVDMVKGKDADASTHPSFPLLQTLVSKLKHSTTTTTTTTVPSLDNFVLVRLGDSERHQMALLLQVRPFVVRYYRVSELSAGPLIVLGEEGKLNFEMRRFRDQPSQGGRKLAEADTIKETITDQAAAAAATPEKEIVGYWEDGLAIYADGTREEKENSILVEPDEEDPEETNEKTHRKLSETDTEGLWEEHFGSHEDSKPLGPMSVGWDVSFPYSRHLYGIPEHAARAVLQTTKGQGAHFHEPYRLYNLDVFEYELDEVMALYGHVPFVVSHSVVTGTAGVFWFNPSETFVDVTQSTQGLDTSSTTHWMSESGVLDVFLLPGPDPKSLYQQYAKLTGVTPLPPMFSLGYHQCRWNYKDEKDVYHVHGKFEELDYPYDVLWLDIEHTDGKRYFTWDSATFPNPKEMQEHLASQGRRMVTIIDPHMKRDNGYYIHKEATSKGLYVKNADGKDDYDGWCWPGSSSYLDFTDAGARQWWAEQFAYNKYKGSTPTLFTWNDMNEPSVFNGPEVSMQKDLKNLAGDEHREWHNIYGMLFHRATGEGQIQRNADQDTRPFVLSRSFFAGSQRYGAIWTGDNAAKWEHLQIAAPMLLSMNTAALSFVGADVGGFFGNTEAQLFTRWMQAGAYQPFFRGHAHHDSARREPWMFDDATLARLRQAAMTRYALLPYWYTVFYEAELTGMPVMRMMWMEYPSEEGLFEMDHQYMIGSDILVHPVIQPNSNEATVVFPAKDSWYDVDNLILVSQGGEVVKGTVEKNVAANLDKIPAYQRGGSIIPRKLRLRRSTMTMKNDPYTLYVALDPNFEASGRLYMDDEESFGYAKRSEYATALFTAKLKKSSGSLRNHVTVGSGWTPDVVKAMEAKRMVERIIVMGVKSPPTSITVGEETLYFLHDADKELLTIRKPGVSALTDWEIVFSHE